MMLQVLFGTFDEFIASPRLLPLEILKIGYLLGYKPEQWTLIQKLADLALAWGDPALDYIGTGGATSLLTAEDISKQSKAAKTADKMLADFKDTQGKLRWPGERQYWSDEPGMGRLRYQVFHDMASVQTDRKAVQAEAKKRGKAFFENFRVDWVDLFDHRAKDKSIILSLDPFASDTVHGLA